MIINFIRQLHCLTMIFFVYSINIHLSHFKFIKDNDNVKWNKHLAATQFSEPKLLYKAQQCGERNLFAPSPKCQCYDRKEIEKNIGQIKKMISVARNILLFFLFLYECLSRDFYQGTLYTLYSSPFLNKTFFFLVLRTIIVIIFSIYLGFFFLFFFSLPLLFRLIL